MLLNPVAASTSASHAADVREVLCRNARRIRPLIELLLKLKLRAVPGHEAWYALDWLRVIYEDKRDELWPEPTAEWTGRWQPLISGPDARLRPACVRGGDALGRSALIAKWFALVALWG
jgi:hypothetical protein